MGSARPQDKSLGGGISLPQWMKGKFDNRFDFDDSAFSPPSHDDNFFFIRYAKNQGTENTSSEFRTISDVISGNKETTTTVQANAANLKDVNQIDFSKHPEPCQPFVPSALNKGNIYKPPKTTVANSIKPKSQGTDDGFHGTPALCGKSIVHVANQMMSGLSKSEHTDNNAFPKGSKSLPVTPIASPMSTPDSSPKSRRRHGNRFFTGAFVPDKEKYQGSWLLAGILGQTREIVSTRIDEEEETTPESIPSRALTRKKSISSQNLTYLGKDEKATAEKETKTSVFQAKPSELREMNFWSPTSM